jgi:hypothetical protein
LPFSKRISPQWGKRHLKKFIKQKNPLARLESWALQTNAARSVCIVPSLDVVVVVVAVVQKKAENWLQSWAPCMREILCAVS